MKRIFVLFFSLIVLLPLTAQCFTDHFCDSTLRIDYIFAGDANRQAIYLDQFNMTPRWYGRRYHLAQLPLKGNGSITLTDSLTGDTLYRHSFSTLFHEWLYTEEAKCVSRSFENVFLVPFPRRAVNITVELRDFHDHIIATLVHTMSPHDILIRHPQVHSSYVTLQQPVDSMHCIHITYVPEGYTENQMHLFLDDCHTAINALFQHEPFHSLRDRFCITALMTPSHDTDVSQPSENVWRNTVLCSHFDTFYSRRYLTTLHLKRLHDLLSGTPYEHIIILANTEHYGGGGIYNSYNLSYTRGKYFRPVVVHEFGHSFAGLADEYPYGDSDPMYFADTEPWEPNLTTHNEYPVKWQDLISQGQASLVEGGGYLSHGVWRSQEDCRMRTNEYPEFCPVCQQAIRRLIDFYTH